MRVLKTFLLIIPIIMIASCANWLSSGGGAQDPTPGPQPPSATLPGSLHGTASGMQWWYDQPDGIGDFIGVTYETAGCGHCHVETCDQCHVNADGSGGVNEPDACVVCHGRLIKEEALGVTDVHFEAGMVCSNCHGLAEMHGDGTSYDSMLVSDNASCENCHSKGGSAVNVPDSQSHTLHGDTLSCDACHMSAAVTCYNCHFQTLLDEHEKKAAGAFKDFILLLNDDNGKVRAGTYQSVYYEDKGFVAYGPFHGHSVSKEGRACADCHNNDRIKELNDTDKIVMTTWNADESKVEHTTGVIPFVPDMLEFQFVDWDGAAWGPVSPSEIQTQYEFCTPLSTDQLTDLGYGAGATGPAATLPDSLHGTAYGMQWWYEQDDGIGDFIDVSYETAGCGHCHVETCDQCHENADGTGEVNDPDVCTVCHGRVIKEEALGVTDLHFEAGMVCTDCHTIREMHGDGNSYNSMLQAGATDTRCESCHGAGGSAAAIPDTPSHTTHDNMRCDACHMSAAVTCYNCHFETLLTAHEKKAAGAFKDFILLLNDENGDIRAGTYQSVYYEDKGFVAFGPFHGHSVVAEGRGCQDCHGNDRIKELNDTGSIVMTTWNAGEGKVEHTTGVIPFVPDALEFQYVDWDGTNWGPVTPSEILKQWEFCTPLTADQLAAMSSSPPTETLPGSLHGTAYGMQWWYEQPDGAGALFGVDYAETGCSGCHIETCDQCHENADGTGAVNDPDVCTGCHGRVIKEEALGVTDLHFEAGMVCTDCHGLAEMHGDGTAYNSMLLSENASCETCHPEVLGSGSPYGSHAVHGDTLSCDACHMESAVTCYNCHFETLLDSHEKKAAAAFKDFIFLLNDDNGKVRAGTYQSVSYDGDTFIAFGPFHGHSVTLDNARDCDDCHGGPRMQEYHLTGEVVVTHWDDVESKIVHTTGVIPFVPDALRFQFVDFDGTNWAPLTTDIDQLQYEYCTPLTEDQLASMAIAWPGGTLASSLHADAGGMQWWFEQPDGLGALIGLSYEDTGCGGCHIDTEAEDGGCSDCHGTADVHDPLVNQIDICKGCHGRQGSEIDMGLTDVHFTMGFECSDCHLYDIHGDGNEYDSMLSVGAMDANCENCHSELNMAITEHTMHSETLHCDACHVSSVITCYNCHIDTLMSEHVKKANSKQQGFVLLLNDTRLGKVSTGSYQSAIEGGDNTFVAYGPFHGHTITADGRVCSDCHDNDRITELNDTGKIAMTWWDAGGSPPGIVHTTGVIPFDPTFLEFEFVDYDSVAETWSPVGTTLDQYQYEFCTPLTADQLADLGVE